MGLILFAFLLLISPLHLLIFHLYFPILFWGHWNVFCFILEADKLTFQPLSACHSQWLPCSRIICLADGLPRTLQ